MGPRTTRQSSVLFSEEVIKDTHCSKTNMDAFIGTWKNDPSLCKGMDDLGKCFGWPDEKIQMYSQMQYSMTFGGTPDAVNGIVDYGDKKQEYNFKMGEAFDWTGPDGTAAKLTVTLEGSTWTEKYHVDAQSPSLPDGVRWTTTRDVAGSVMSVATVFDAAGVKCTQQLNKV